jgi:hypothetical protein
MKPETANFLLLVLLASLLSGCASSAPPLPPSLELPAPVTDLRAVRKGNKVYLAWTVPAETTDHESILHRGPAEICRSRATPMSVCGTPVGEVPAPTATETAPAGAKAPPPRVMAGFIDSLPVLPDVIPSDEITYAVEVFNESHRGAGLSNQLRVPLWPAIPPPSALHAEVIAQGVQISCTCPPLPAKPEAGVQYRLRVYRRLEGSQSDARAGEADLKDCQTLSLSDSTFEWEKVYGYRAAVVTIVSAGLPSGKVIEIEGDDTASVTVRVHDVFPPAVPSGLQAVFSGVGQQPFVDLVWAPNGEADLAGYNLYRREAGRNSIKINQDPAKTPAYRDAAVQSGKKYFYSVTAVDVRGNESARSEEASEAVP